MSTTENLRKAGWNDTVITLADSLASDGYDLDLYRHDDGTIRAQVTARPGACQDCLVPEAVATAILATACGVDDSAIHLQYPD